MFDKLVVNEWQSTLAAWFSAIHQLLFRKATDPQTRHVLDEQPALLQTTTHICRCCCYRNEDADMTND